MTLALTSSRFSQDSWTIQVNTTISSSLSCTARVKEVRGRDYQVVMGGPPNPVVGNANPKHNTPAAAAQGAYRDLRQLNPDIVLESHPNRSFEGKIEAMKARARPHPLLLAPGQWTRELDESVTAYNKKLAAAN